VILPGLPPMFRFTIRDVLWLTAVVALLVAWWIDHRTLAPDAKAFRKQQVIYSGAIDSPAP